MESVHKRLIWLTFKLIFVNLNIFFLIVINKSVLKLATLSQMSPDVSTTLFLKSDTQSTETSTNFLSGKRAVFLAVVVLALLFSVLISDYRKFFWFFALFPANRPF